MRGKGRSKIRNSRGWCRDTCSGKAKKIAEKLSCGRRLLMCHQTYTAPRIVSATQQVTEDGAGIRWKKIDKNIEKHLDGKFSSPGHLKVVAQFTRES